MNSSFFSDQDQESDQKFRDEESNEEANTFYTGLITISSTLQNMKRRKPGPRKPNENLGEQKGWWTRGYARWDGEQFRRRLRITRRAFEMLLTELAPLITKTPTNLVPDPIEGKYQGSANNANYKK